MRALDSKRRSEAVSVYSFRILFIYPVKPEGIPVLPTDTHLMERLTDIASEGDRMKSVSQKYLPKLILK